VAFLVEVNGQGKYFCGSWLQAWRFRWLGGLVGYLEIVQDAELALCRIGVYSCINCKSIQNAFSHKAFAKRLST
jgi:hypothetical protein